MTRDYEVLTLAPEGLGYGKGAISVNERLANPEDPLAAEDVTLVETAVKSEQAVVAVGKDAEGRFVQDDGCPDGRGVARILHGDSVKTESLPRPKVFGGGLTMGVAGLVATDKFEGSTAEAFAESASLFRINGIDYGAHTSDHANAESSGCGAIDGAPEIFESAVEFAEDIKSTMSALAGPEADHAELDGMIDTAIENMGNFSKNQNQQDRPYSGRKVMENIAANGKIIKELNDDHKEVRIVLNLDIENATVDQGYIREITGGKAQVFAVDVPRMRRLADGLFAEDTDKQQAFVGMFVYSLATAATLTKGDLPIDAIYSESPYVDFAARDRKLAV